MIELREGQVVAGKYRLDRLLARGGMGSVWAAQHLKLEVPVAIKFMDPSLAASADARGRFEREAKAAASLRTPHVVQIHDHGLDGDTPYIAMELLQGEDLGAKLRREKRLSLPVASQILTQAAKALRLAHDTGIVHRDLKPGNIFLARNDDDEVVKILDFGIAKAGTAMVGETTKTGELLGSPDYMSPEQARGSKNVDGRSDLWSLAVILFRALTGVKAFKGDSLGDVIVKICVEPVPIPSSIAPDLPPEIDQFFEKALARDPAERFQSAREMAAEFAIAAGGSTWMARDSSIASILERPPASSSGFATRPPSDRPATPSDAAAATASGSVGAVSIMTDSRPSSPGTLTNASLVTPQAGRLRRPIVLWGIGAGAFTVVLAAGIFAITRSPSQPTAAASAAPEVGAAVASTALAAEKAASTASPPTSAPSPEPAEPGPGSPAPAQPEATAKPSAEQPHASDAPKAPSKAAHGAATSKTQAEPPAHSPATAAPVAPKKKPNFGY